MVLALQGACPPQRREPRPRRAVVQGRRQRRGQREARTPCVQLEQRQSHESQAQGTPPHCDQTQASSHPAGVLLVAYDVLTLLAVAAFFFWLSRDERRAWWRRPR